MVVGNRRVESGSRDLTDLAKFIDSGRNAARFLYARLGKSALRRLFNFFQFLQVLKALAEVLGPAIANAYVE